MKAVRFHEYGDASVLRYEDTERPEPGAGQVLVKVAGTSFNPLDAAIRAGFVRDAFPLTFPHTPGIDVAGTVAALGAGVSGFDLGDPVVGFLPANADGAAAEYVVAAAEILAAAPKSIQLADAAALPAVGLTAWQALFEHADLKAGQRILINGAGGAVGGYAVQLAARAGATVLATASSRSAERVRAHGAAEVIDHTAGPLAAAVTEPVDIVLNLVAGAPEAMVPLLALVKPGGLFLTTAADAPTDTDVRAVHMYVRSDAAQLATLVAEVDAGRLRVDVAERYPLSELAAVQDLGLAGKLPGKVVLVP